MRFMEDFELYIDDRMFFVEVEGHKIKEEYGFGYETYFSSIYITDENGDSVFAGHYNYDEIMKEIHNREYEVEYDRFETDVS